MSYHVALTLKSRNAKVGAIPVSTTTHETCPDACPLAANGCYAESGPLAMFWRKVTEKKAGNAWQQFCKQIAALPDGQFWRHNQAGDLPGDKRNIDAAALAALVDANAGKHGLTYTHYDVIENAANREAVRAANDAGFRINLSANTLAHADALLETKAGPVVVVLPADAKPDVATYTPNGARVVICPATYKDKVSCDTCRLCVRTRETVVGFPAHGTSKKKASAVAAA